MPFTPSHIAAVLPLRGRKEHGLPLAALAVGSMSPDFLYYLPVPGWRTVSQQTHSLLGILTWDLLFGLVMWLAWRVAATAVHDLAPAAVRRRWRPALWPTGVRQWMFVVLAVLVGAATHVFWDGFTHSGGFAVLRLPALTAEFRAPWASLPVYQWLQYASGAIGLAVVVWAGLRQPVSEPSPSRRPQLARLTPWVLAAGALLAVLVRLAIRSSAPDSHSGVFVSITAAFTGAAAAAFLLCAACLALPRPAATDRDPVRILDQ